MKFNFKKILSIGTPLLGIGSIASYYTSQLFTKDSSSNVEVKNNDVIKINNVHSNSDVPWKIFPDKLNANDFYDEIRIDDQSQSFISDEMVAIIVQKCVKKMSIVEGNIKWGYYFHDISRQKVTISLEFNPKISQDKIIFRNYTFILKQGFVKI